VIDCISTASDRSIDQSIDRSYSPQTDGLLLFINTIVWAGSVCRIISSNRSYCSTLHAAQSPRMYSTYCRLLADLLRYSGATLGADYSLVSRESRGSLVITDDVVSDKSVGNKRFSFGGPFLYFRYINGVPF